MGINVCIAHAPTHPQPRGLFYDTPMPQYSVLNATLSNTENTHTYTWILHDAFVNLIYACPHSYPPTNHPLYTTDGCGTVGRKRAHAHIHNQTKTANPNSNTKQHTVDNPHKSLVTSVVYCVQSPTTLRDFLPPSHTWLPSFSGGPTVASPAIDNAINYYLL